MCLIGLCKLPTPIHGDNTASIALISAGVTKRSKHFAIEWHYFRELVEAKELVVHWVPTGENLADFFRSLGGRSSFTSGINSWVRLRNNLIFSPLRPLPLFLPRRLLPLFLPQLPQSHLLLPPYPLPSLPYAVCCVSQRWNFMGMEL